MELIVGGVGSIDTNGNEFISSVAGPDQYMQIGHGIPNSLEIMTTSAVRYATSAETEHAFTANSTSTVPEPSAIALMGLGLLGFGVTRRKQKKN